MAAFIINIIANIKAAIRIDIAKLLLFNSFISSISFVRRLNILKLKKNTKIVPTIAIPSSIKPSRKTERVIKELMPVLDGGATRPFNTVSNGFDSIKDMLIINVAIIKETLTLLFLISSISSMSVVSNVKSLIASHKTINAKILKKMKNTTILIIAIITIINVDSFELRTVVKVSIAGPIEDLINSIIPKIKEATKIETATLLLLISLASSIFLVNREKTLKLKKNIDKPKITEIINSIKP